MYNGIARKELRMKKIHCQAAIHDERLFPAAINDATFFTTCELCAIIDEV
jgi:hypothetical protein